MRRARGVGSTQGAGQAIDGGPRAPCAGQQAGAWRASGKGAGATPQVNWSGILTVVVAFVLAHYVLNKSMPIEFFTSLPISLVLYPILRLGSGGRL